MKPAPRSDAELLAWAASIIQKEQCDKSYGTVTIHLEGGIVTRAKVERSEQPPRENQLTVKKVRQ